MNELNQVEGFLEKFNFNYKRIQNEIKVRLHFGLEFTIHSNKSNQIILKDRVVAWNFLTGIVEMTLKHALIYSFFGLLVGSILTYFLNDVMPQKTIILCLVVVLIWMVFWFLYYLVVSEQFKQSIYKLHKD